MGKFTRPSGGGFNRDRGDRGDRGSRGGFGGDRGSRGGFGGDRGGRGGFGGGRDRDRGDREMHSAICDECGKECQLPFRPSSDKPVYCSDCFSKHREDRPKRDFGGGRDRGSRGVGSDLQKQIDTINTKLDRILGRLGTDMPKLADEKVEKVKEEKKVVKKEAKKEVKKEEPKKTAKKAVKKVAAKKAPAKKTTKKK